MPNVSDIVRHFHGCPESLDDPRLPALFVVPSEAYASAGAIAALSPALVLQLHRGASPLNEETVRSHIAYAIEDQDVHAVVLCREAAPVRDPWTHDAARAALAAEAGRLIEDPHVGALLRARGVRVEALWIDPWEGDLWLLQRRTGRFELLSDPLLEELVARIQAPPTPRTQHAAHASSRA